MPKITFQVSYDFLLGLLVLPDKTRILDVQRGKVPLQFTVEAETPDASGRVEPIFNVLTPRVILFREWKKLEIRNGST